LAGKGAGGVGEIVANLPGLSIIRANAILTKGVNAMGILGWIIMGLIAGFLAKLILPGRDPGGIIVTIIIGIVGAVIGGYIGTHLGWGTVTGFDLRSLGLAIGGAILLLIGYRIIT
jgi:uncharacterized membrane protein YeaQ/YmgE (transglycosylase-associated protein family)